MACSLDGFVAGVGDDISWLPTGDTPGMPPPPGADALGFDEFLSQVGCMIMGRRTHDIVAAFGVWPYGDLPILVATHRALQPAAPTVRPIAGDIRELVREARVIAGSKDVYLDGADLVRQALDADLVDELTLTLIPILLGSGIRLFKGLRSRHMVEFTAHHRYGNDLLQVTVRPRGS